MRNTACYAPIIYQMSINSLKSLHIYYFKIIVSSQLAGRLSLGQFDKIRLRYILSSIKARILILILGLLDSSGNFLNSASCVTRKITIFLSRSFIDTVQIITIQEFILGLKK
jgi:hypothetical protein